MSSCKDLVVEPSQLGSLKGLNGTRNTRIILVQPLTVKVKAYVQFEVLLIRVTIARELNSYARLSIRLLSPKPLPGPPFI